jgi:hypothetical protein
MKKYLISPMFKYTWLVIAAMVALSACDDDDDNGPIDEIPAEDGIYVSGPATGFTDLELDGMMDAGREEGDGFASVPREGMYEKFMYLNSGDFRIVMKSGATENEYGWVAGTQGTFNPEGEGDEVDGDVYYGEYETDGISFNAPANGFYHIVLDQSTSMVYYTLINHWAVIGDATDQGWSAEYPMTQTSLSATEAEWEVTDLVLRERGGFKFRYNDGWKITTDDFIIFANIGADNSNFITGGDLFPYPDGGEGEYTVTLGWTIEDGFSYNTERTGDVEPLPDYPAELYMIGDGVGGWEWDEIDLPMVPTAGNKDHLFWKIVWMEATGAFKFSPERAWAGDFGKTGDAADGVYEIGGDDIPVPGEAGYYIVVVNLETEQIAISEPQVYLIGETVGDDWEQGNQDALFTVDNENEILTLTRNLDAGELRMYAWFDLVEDWFTDWWQHEFMIFDGEIEFRGRGDDQERVTVPAGEHRIDLNFRTNEGSITQP